MSVPVLKALARRIRKRYGSTAEVALAAECSPGLWSGWENDDHPDKTIPIPRFLKVANTAERAALISLIQMDMPPEPGCVMTEASEATEAAAGLQRTVRLAANDGSISATEARQIVREAEGAKAEINDVIAAVQGAA